jgi:hypothetical protein
MSIACLKLQQEITLLLEEEDVQNLPEGSYIVSPGGWLPIKMYGRHVSLHETGVVSNAMHIG